MNQPLPSAGGFNPTGTAGKPRKRKVKAPLVPTEPLTGPTKAQVVIEPDGSPSVVNVKAGPVTWRDKVKAYYHTVIIVVTGLLAFLTEVTPLGNFLPDQYRAWFAGGVLFVGALVTFLKSNETWVNNL